MRNGSGNPPLCSAHRIAVVEEARQQDTSPARRAGAAVGSILDDFLSGRPFDPSHIKTAVSDFSWAIGGGYGEYRPDIGERPTMPRGHAPPPPPPSWFREEPPPGPPPGPDPATVTAARRELGFGPSDTLSAELVKERRRKLARKHHPDRGGSADRMKRINDAVDVLMSTL